MNTYLAPTGFRVRGGVTASQVPVVVLPSYSFFVASCNVALFSGRSASAVNCGGGSTGGYTSAGKSLGMHTFNSVGSISIDIVMCLFGVYGYYGTHGTSNCLSDFWVPELKSCALMLSHSPISFSHPLTRDDLNALLSIDREAVKTNLPGYQHLIYRTRAK